MKVILRNLQPVASLDLNFIGYNVTPFNVSILTRKSAVVVANMSVLEFRQIPDVTAALAAGFLSFSADGGAQSLN